MPGAGMVKGAIANRSEAYPVLPQTFKLERFAAE